MRAETVVAHRSTLTTAKDEFAMAKSFIRRKIEIPNPVHVGAKFGRLLVISDGWEQVSPKGWCSEVVQVRCDCGTEKFIRPHALRAGHTKSCGCLQRETATILGFTKNLKHGHNRKYGERVPEYGVHATMLSRCYNPNVNKYADYGGRGIAVCERWRGEGGYERFIQDMGRRPGKGWSLERVDNDGPYSPGNCRWATNQEQCNNRRSNLVVEYDGRSQTLTEWTRELGFNFGTVYTRLELGWTVEQALSTPVNSARG